MATKPKSTKTKTTRTATDIATGKLTEARNLVTQREAEHEQAEVTEAELITRLTRGDASVSALDLVTAEAEITRLGYLIEAARKAVKPAEQALDSAQALDNPSLARFIAERIEADGFAFGVFGMPLVINGGDDRTKPGVYINQANATTTNPATGITSGRVGITVVSPNGKPVDGAAMLAGLHGIERSGAALVSTHASPSPSGVHVGVNLSNVKPDLPTLAAEADGKALREFALDLADSIANQGGKSKQGTSDPYGGGMYGGDPRWDMGPVRNILTGLDSAIVTSQKQDGDQVSRTVRVEFTLSSRKFGANEIREFTRTSAGKLVGEFVAGVGRVKAARVVDDKVTREEATPGKEYRNNLNTSVRVTIEVDAVARIAG